MLEPPPHLVVAPDGPPPPPQPSRPSAPTSQAVDSSCVALAAQSRPLAAEEGSSVAFSASVSSADGPVPAPQDAATSLHRVHLSDPASPSKDAGNGGLPATENVYADNIRFGSHSPVKREREKERERQRLAEKVAGKQDSWLLEQMGPVGGRCVGLGGIRGERGSKDIRHLHVSPELEQMWGGGDDAFKQGQLLTAEMEHERCEDRLGPLDPPDRHDDTYAQQTDQCIQESHWQAMQVEMGRGMVSLTLAPQGSGTGGDAVIGAVQGDGVGAGAGGANGIEKLRHKCEEELGLDLFLDVYQHLRGQDEGPCHSRHFCARAA